jgi:DNA-binding transcriptional LysR family regulator
LWSRFGTPPSTRSRRIQQLEQHLGVRLMQRSSHRLALTGAGQDFFQRSAEKIDGLAESVRQMLNAGESVSGRVRVATMIEQKMVDAVPWAGRPAQDKSADQTL